MSPESQRIAIAEACGWKWEPPHWRSPSGKLHQTFWPTDSKSAHARVLPDYLEDLNAMHGAERAFIDMPFSGRLMVSYVHNLSKVAGRPCDMGWGVTVATAKQRAEAFLRTIGKWEAPPTP